jgi:DNA-binding NarL/FixJ family response regulator
LQGARVLVVVRTLPLMRVIDHLFCDEPGVRVIARSNNGDRLVPYSACLRPELIIAHARLLGKTANKALAEIKRSSPASKVILICSSQKPPHELRRCGADACLREEALVQRLPLVVRKLLSNGNGALSTKRKDPVRVADRGEANQKGRLNA